MFTLCLLLMGCTQKDEAVKGAYNLKGIITKIDMEGNRILAEDNDKNLFWITLHEDETIKNFTVGQEIAVWVDGGIDTSSPAYIKAFHIEILGEKVTKTVEPSLPEFIFDKDEFPPAITAFVTFNETRYKMTQGNFKWEKGNKIIQTDASSPAQIAENFKAIIVEPNSTAIIEIEQKPHLNVYLWDSDKAKLAFQGSQISVPTIKGRYIYEVVAKWSNGEISYTFVVETK